MRLIAFAVFLVACKSNAPVSPITALEPDIATPLDTPPAAEEDPGPPPIDSPYTKSPTVPFATPKLAIPIPKEAKAGPFAPGVWVMPNGRVLRPAGEQMDLGSYPLGLALSSNGKTLYVSANAEDHMQIQVVDLASRTVVQRIDKPTLYRFLIVDGPTLYASGGPTAPVYRFPIDEGGQLGDATEIPVAGGAYGIALSADKKTLHTAKIDVTAPSGHQHLLDAIDLDTLTSKGTLEVGRIPYDITATQDAVYLVAWEAGAVQRIRGTTIDTLPVGQHPQALVLHGDRLYVSVTDSDTVLAVDTTTFTIVAKTPVNLAPAGGSGEAAPSGRDPGFMALSPDGARLYVVCAMSNEVVVIDTKAMTVAGTIPVGWYPAAIAVAHDGKTLYVANSKGTGIPPWNDGKGSVEEAYVGTLSIIPVPDDATLAANVEQVLAQNLGVSGLGRYTPTDDERAILPDAGGSPKIKHVVYLMRENKTFDVQLGDMHAEDPNITGDPSLTLFGEEFTPNLHRLARNFCLLDNFYSDGDYSATGHSYATAGKPSDYIEKFYSLPGHTIDSAWGVSPPSIPGHGFFFANILAHGLTVRSFGEGVGMIDDYHFENVLDFSYPGVIFSLEVPDLKKADYFAQWIQENELPSFSFISLPVNHTCCGNDPDHVSPKSMIAENDEATGRVVEALSQSPYWDSTVIFIFEDDPQDGGDSVYYHRSPLVVVSPWSRRGVVNHVHHAIGSIHATMERVLDVSPLTELDAFASPIYGCFTTEHDGAPYDRIPRTYPPTLNKVEPKKADMTDAWRRMRFDEPDENVGLGRVLWKMYRGTEPPWPDRRLTPAGEDVD